MDQGRNRTGRGYRRAMVFVAVAVMTIAGCAVSYSQTSETPAAAPSEPESSSDSTTAGSRSNDKDSPAVADDSESSEATTDPATTVPTTTDAPSGSDAEETPGPALDCEGFTELSAYAQMVAVENARAPQDDACAEPVAAASKSNDVFQKAVELYADFGVGDYPQNQPTLFNGLSCSGGVVSSEVTNAFDTAIIVWGAAFVVDGGADLALLDRTVFVSEVIEPGASTTLDLDLDLTGTDDPLCYFQTRVLIAPIGEFTADAGFVPASSDDPQLSDDPTVWLPALRKFELRLGADFSADALVANVEDLHSPDLASVLGAPSNPDTDEEPGGADEEPGGADVDLWRPRTAPAAVNESGVEICSANDVTEGRDSSGQLVLVVFTVTIADESQLVAGMFRRGSDGLWRYVGLVVSLDVEANAGSCDGAPTLPVPGQR